MTYLEYSAEKMEIPIERVQIERLQSHNPELGHEDIHLLFASLDQNDSIKEKLFEFLTDEEVRRSMRFRFKKDRDHFVIARGLLRNLLGTYLEIHPKEVVIERARMGKPRLKMDGFDEIYFNVSHSGERVFYGFTRIDEVGVDIEYKKDKGNFLELAERFFAKMEYQELSELSGDMLREGFYNLWTRKEAYIKMEGTGLSRPLNSFVVSCAPGEKPLIRSVDGEEHSVDRWTLHSLDIENDYAAAWCLRGKARMVSCYSLASIEM